ncbi:MAG: hypothetical protein JHC73_05600 [Dolichospermum sp.]|nr:hypothetical protein [Dolichospermum sp.]
MDALPACIETQILVTTDLSPDECDDLIKRLDICQEAKKLLMSLEISWDDYLDLIESAGVDMTDFLQTADDNAFAMGF